MDAGSSPAWWRVGCRVKPGMVVGRMPGQARYGGGYSAGMAAELAGERPVQLYQVSFSCSFTTSPMTIIDGGLTSRSATVFARVDTVPT